MEITVHINSCKDCRHLDHSGAFTKGGAKPICGHDRACKRRNLQYDKYHWKQRVLPMKIIIEKNEHGQIINEKKEFIGTIPSWCPLKNGCSY